MCGEDDCPHCGSEVHSICASIPLARITRLLNEKVTNYKDFVSQILEMDNKLIETIRQSRKQLVSNHVKGLFRKQVEEIVSEIYKKKNANYLTGKKAEYFCQFIKEESSYMKNNPSNTK